jgi:hypothetical protein
MKIFFYKLLIINILVLISGQLFAQPQANITAMIVKL